MAISTTAPIKRAIVQRLRGNTAITSGISGGIHERIAPAKVKYPFIVYSLVVAPYAFTWGGLEIKARFDIFAFAENPVEANNLDSLIASELHDAPLAVDGQSTLLCRRIADTPTGPDVDADGRRIYQYGGTYAVWTDQPA